VPAIEVPSICSGTVMSRRYQLNEMRPWPRRSASVDGSIFGHAESSKSRTPACGM